MKHSVINGKKETLRDFCKRFSLQFSDKEMQAFDRLFLQNSISTLSEDDFTQDEIWLLRSLAKLFENTFQFLNDRELNGQNLAFINSCINDLRFFFDERKGLFTYCNFPSKEYVFSDILNSSYTFFHLHELSEKFFMIQYKSWFEVGVAYKSLVVEYQKLFAHESIKMCFYFNLWQDSRLKSKNIVAIKSIKPSLHSYTRGYVDNVVLFFLRKFIRENYFVDSMIFLSGEDINVSLKTLPVIKEFSEASEETYRQMLEDKSKMVSLAQDMGFFVF